MKKKIIGLFLGCLLSYPVLSQTDPPSDYRNFPIILTLQFHALTLPFQNMKSNFSNVGIGIGTEFSLNGKHNLAQQLNALWYHNKSVGNGVLLYTQTAWRPAVISSFYSEIKMGAGYLLAYRPVESFKQEEGEWIAVGRQGKGMLAVPVGISIGYNRPSLNSYVSPFISYQLLLLTGYNKSLPFVPETLFQFGARIHY